MDERLETRADLLKGVPSEERRRGLVLVVFKKLVERLEIVRFDMPDRATD